MQILNQTRLMLNFAGLLTSFNPELWYKIITILCLSNMIWIAFFQIPYFFKLEDMTEFSDVLSLFCQYIMMFLRCVLFLYHNTKIRKFILAMEKNVNQKILMGRGKLYEKADKVSNTLTSYYRIFMSILTVGYLFYPVQIAIYQYCTGVTEVSWKLPIKVDFPWGIFTISNYVITFTAVSLNLLSTLLYVLCLDTFFFGVIIHMSACFQDLQDMINETDTIASGPDDGVSLNENYSGETERHLITCINYHNLCITFVETMEEIISSSLFVAYMIIIFLICAVLYQASEHMMSSQITRDFMFVISALIQLLVSTSFGSLITQKSEEVAVTVYSTQWYRQPPKLRLYYQLILLRSQKPVYLTTFTLFNSSLDSFSKIISNSMKAFALLQTIQEKTI